MDKNNGMNKNTGVNTNTSMNQNHGMNTNNELNKVVSNAKLRMWRRRIALVLCAALTLGVFNTFKLEANTYTRTTSIRLTVMIRQVR